MTLGRREREIIVCLSEQSMTAEDILKRMKTKYNVSMSLPSLYMCLKRLKTKLMVQDTDSPVNPINKFQGKNPSLFYLSGNAEEIVKDGIVTFKNEKKAPEIGSLQERVLIALNTISGQVTINEVLNRMKEAGFKGSYASVRSALNGLVSRDCVEMIKDADADPRRGESMYYYKAISPESPQRLRESLELLYNPKNFRYSSTNWPIVSNE